MTSEPSAASSESRRTQVKLEICVETAAGALAALRAGADRVELCCALAEGGVTPSVGAIEAAIRAVTAHDGSLPDVRVLVRPRGGDFVYDALEFDAMRRDIDLARTSGARGVVLGLLTPTGEVDLARTAELVSRARPLHVTFHRAFDMTRDRPNALEALVGLGIDAVLTSGGHTSVLDGLDAVRELVDVAAGRIEIIAGGGVRAESVAQVAERTRADTIHASARSPRASAMQHRNPHCRMTSVPPPGEYERLETDESIVRRCLDALGRDTDAHV